MCSSFPFKLGGEDEVLESSLRATIEAGGFMSKARGAWISYRACMSGQNEQGREKIKNAHFQERDGEDLVASMEVWGVPEVAQGSPMAMASCLLKLGLGGGRCVCVCVCVCVCMCEELIS